MKKPPCLTTAQKAQILGEESPQAGPQKALAIAKSRQQPRYGLITLLEIVEILDAIGFARTWERLLRIKASVEKDAKVQPQSLYNPLDQNILDQLIVDLRKIHEALHLEQGLIQICNLEFRLDDGSPFLNKDIVALLDGIQMRTCADFSQRAFVQIPSSKMEYFNDPINPFGKKVYDAFESARSDMLAAGNSLALDLNTACVFHLMRVVEYGLRAIAQKLRVKTARPVDRLDWGQLIMAVRKSIAARRKKWSSGIKQRKGEADAVNAYEALIDDANVFRVYWRNNTMHSRAIYDAKEAQGVFVRVKEFMQRLEKEVSKK